MFDKIFGLFPVLPKPEEEAASVRKREAIKRTAYYEGEQESYLQELVAAKFAEPEKLTLSTYNIVKKVVNNLAVSYIRQPKRELVEATDADRQAWQEIFDSTSLASKMSKASRMVKLHKTIMLRPVWRGRMELDILTPDILDVETGDTPQDIKAVIVTNYCDDAEKVTYERVTADTVTILDYTGGEVSTEPNPFGVIPFLPVWDDENTTSHFFLQQDGDLISNQDAINLLLTAHNHTIEMQGFAVGYIKSDSAMESLTLGAGKFVQLPVSGEVGFAAPDAPIKEVGDAIDARLVRIAQTYGLDGSVFSLNHQRESGKAITAGSFELIEMRHRDVETFRQCERRLFDLFRIVWNTYSPSRRIGDKAALRTDFHDIPERMSLEGRIDACISLMDRGIYSHVDVIRQMNPDLKSREEAIERLKQVQAENAMFDGKPSLADDAPTQ